MKKFVLKVLLFFALVIAMDFAWGRVFSWLRSHAKGGSTANCEYIANHCEDDIIILGSSRATHHYVPQIIEDSLGMSCYNCGEEGNGVVLAYGRLKMLTNRYKPKLVLYEITPNYDYGSSEPNNKYLGYLRAYYDKDGISEIFADFDDDLSWLKMKSKMYQNTSRLLPDLVDNVLFRDNKSGYEPLCGQISIANDENSSSNKTITIDEIKLSYLEKLIDLCKNDEIDLVFMISPWYKYSSTMTEYEPAIRLCVQKGVRVCNYLNESSMAESPNLFQDANHLNNDGAILFTQNIIPLLKQNIH